jgi:predicted nuclease of predicted toxin-antitoxin system
MLDSPRADPLFVRLYLDLHVKLRLAEDLCERGYDVINTQQTGRETASDDEQLEFATQEGRALVTYNIRDFVPLHESWTALGRSHAGIIVSQQLGSRQYGLLLSRMLRLLDHFTADEIRGNLVHLEQFK